MDGEKRRQQIMEILNQETAPVSGTELAKRAGVSRQVVVQDIALLRAENKEIMSTNKGYVSIEHTLYGQISVDLIINNRLDAQEFVNQMAMSRDEPLKALTGGCHYHTVAAESEKNLDMIEMELQRKGYLA